MSKNAPFFKLYDIWSADEKYLRHRIPGMIVTAKSTLIIYNEARTEPGDLAPMDIFMQRSTDHGATFGEPIYLAYGTEKFKTVNNPVMIQDKNNRIHFLYCENYSVSGGRVLRKFSDDDGISWSEPVDITAATAPEYRNTFALGPGHGIMTSNGDLVVAVWMVPKSFEAPEKAHFPSVVSTLYSTDNGENWQLGEILHSNAEIQHPNESSLTNLSDGSVYLNIRCRNHYRAKAVSKNGYSGWEQYSPDKNLHDPQCFGSVASFVKNGYPCTILFANCDSKHGRKNVTIKGSLDDAKTFSLRKIIDADRGGYVELAVDAPNNIIYTLYENAYGETMHLAVFNYEELI